MAKHEHDGIIGFSDIRLPTFSVLRAASGGAVPSSGWIGVVIRADRQPISREPGAELRVRSKAVRLNRARALGLAQGRWRPSLEASKGINE
ncbi:hypothetical protein ABIF78_002528 [Bradyrhizobium japonicum]|jgi:hypothetical protein